MSDVVSLGSRVSNLDVSPQFENYSRVIIHIDDKTQVSVGDDSGRTMELDNPFGTRRMAEQMLARLRGFQYQPYSAESALLDPSAEIGDAVNMASVYGGLYNRSRTFGRLMKADISAPHDEEIDHEYEFIPPEERKYSREIGEVKASIILTNNMIRQEVLDRQNSDNEMSSQLTQTAANISATMLAKQGGNTSTFGWVLDAFSHVWSANNREVMRISASGLKVTGEVEATSGKIGGFDIGARELKYNGLNFGDTDKNYGAYVGQSGIQLGKNFKVDNSGSVTASSLKLRGTITFLNDDGSTAGTMSAANLRTGASQAFSNYSSWNGTTSTVGSNAGYWSGGAAGGYSWNNTQDRVKSTNPNVWLGNATCVSVLASNFYLGNYRGQWQTLTINGVQRTVLVGTYYG